MRELYLIIKDPLTPEVKEYYRFKFQYAADVVPLVNKEPANLFKATCGLFESIKNLSSFPKWTDDVHVKVELTYYDKSKY